MKLVYTSCIKWYYIDSLYNMYEEVDDSGRGERGMQRQRGM